MHSLGTGLHECFHALGTGLHECFHALGTDVTHAGSGSAPASRRLVPARGGLGYACSADAGDTGNLLDREMCPPEPQQTGITLESRQGLEQRRIYVRQDFVRNGKGLLIGDPPAWKNLY